MDRCPGQVPHSSFRNTHQNPADFFTKPLARAKFEHFRDMIMGGDLLQGHFMQSNINQTPNHRYACNTHFIHSLHPDMEAEEQKGEFPAHLMKITYRPRRSSKSLKKPKKRSWALAAHPVLDLGRVGKKAWSFVCSWESCCAWGYQNPPSPCLFGNAQGFWLQSHPKQWANYRGLYRL